MLNLSFVFGRAGVFSALFFFLTGCSGLFYQPDSLLHYPPAKMGFKAQELKFAAKDGTNLVAWFLPAPNPKGTIVQFHGNAENLSSHYTFLAWVTRHGYNLFTFDYRGYGGSDGEPDQAGTHLDALAALDKAWELNQAAIPHGKFVIFGQSLGGVISARALKDFSHQSEVTLLVQDSTFVSYKKVAARVMKSHWWLWPFHWLAYLTISNEYGSESVLKTRKIPLLVIHDKRDPAVAFENGEELYELSAPPKEMWVTDSGTHLGLFGEEGLEWRKKFLDYLEKL